MRWPKLELWNGERDLPWILGGLVGLIVGILALDAHFTGRRVAATERAHSAERRECVVLLHTFALTPYDTLAVLAAKPECADLALERVRRELPRMGEAR